MILYKKLLFCGFSLITAFAILCCAGCGDPHRGEQGPMNQGSNFHPMDFPPPPMIDRDRQDDIERTISDMIVKESDAKKDDKNLALAAKKIKDGEHLRNVLPPPFFKVETMRSLGPMSLIIGLAIPLTAIIGFCIILLFYIRLRHIRDMLLIEKGLYRIEDARIIRFDLTSLAGGIILIFWGCSLFLFNALTFGAGTRSLAMGIIPFTIGLGFIAVFFLIRLAQRNKK